MRCREFGMHKVPEADVWEFGALRGGGGAEGSGTPWL